MTDATATAAAAPTDAPAPRPARAPRRGLHELTFRLDEADVARHGATEPDWLGADRRAAFERYASLPVETNQLYTTYIDLRAADLAEVEPRRSRGTTAGTAGEALPDGTAGLAAIREDRVVTLRLDASLADAGVILDTLDGLLARDPELARRLLADESSLPLDDKLAQMTRAGWNQGVVVHVPAGVRADRPIVIQWQAGEAGRASLTRTIVDLGAGASASIVEELTPSLVAAEPADGGQSLFTGSLEIHLAEGAELRVASIQDLAASTIAFQHRQAEIGEGASLQWALAQLGSRIVRSRVDNRLVGNRSTVEQVEIVFGSDDQIFDLTSYTRHIGRDTTGNLLSKAALLDATRSYMKGLIVIEPTAVGTDSFLGEFGMNLSKQARAVAIPSLEIDQPDCRRAAHSSSVGPIDETQLFYLESRGIPPAEARKFIVLGFLEPVVARVPLESAREQLRGLLEAKWDGAAVADAGEPSTAPAA
ncbi:MAG TPA: SufD family Fe-S cluster assembly protein [Candidatus Limnocylindrales bacterium]|nr:SufD family Fe-S cluster assembly protein [Candidatus Limnocylindrales bacterium]